MKHKPEEYKHIRTWGRMMLSDAWYIKDQQQRASEEDAPLDAIYKNREGEGQGWAQFAEVTNPTTTWYFKQHHK